jgi:hypothetical protein
MIVNAGVKTIIMRTGPAAFEEIDPVVLYQKRSREALES